MCLLCMHLRVCLCAFVCLWQSVPVQSCIKVSDSSVFSSARKLQMLYRAVELLCACECLFFQLQHLEVTAHLCSGAIQSLMQLSWDTHLSGWGDSTLGSTWIQVHHSSTSKVTTRQHKTKRTLIAFAFAVPSAWKTLLPSLLMAGSILLFRLQLNYCSP